MWLSFEEKIGSLTPLSRMEFPTHQVDQSISILRVDGCFFSNFNITGCDPDQMPLYGVSDLGLHCLPMYHKKDARLIWVNRTKFYWS